MITTKQEKGKTTIIVPRRMKKQELERVIRSIEQMELTGVPTKKVSKTFINKISREINRSAWEKFKKDRGIE